MDTRSYKWLVLRFSWPLLVSGDFWETNDTIYISNSTHRSGDSPGEGTLSGGTPLRGGKKQWPMKRLQKQTVYINGTLFCHRKVVNTVNSNTFYSLCTFCIQTVAPRNSFILSSSPKFRGQGAELHILYPERIQILEGLFLQFPKPNTKLWQQFYGICIFFGQRYVLKYFGLKINIITVIVFLVIAAVSIMA